MIHLSRTSSLQWSPSVTSGMPKWRSCRSDFRINPESRVGIRLNVQVWCFRNIYNFNRFVTTEITWLNPRDSPNSSSRWSRDPNYQIRPTCRSVSVGWLMNFDTLTLVTLINKFSLNLSMLLIIYESYLWVICPMSHTFWGDGDLEPESDPST